MLEANNPFTILLAGDITPSPRLSGQVQGTRIIACDGGIRHAKTLGLQPEVWVGDFDSALESDKADFANLPTQAHPQKKNATDGQIAMEEALVRGADGLILVGAFGGRTDHSFAIMTQACALAETGTPVLLTDGREEAVVLSPSPRTFDYSGGTQFSVLAFTDLTGLTLTGAVWPLEERDMPFGDTLTISNEVAGTMSAKLRGGRALLIAQIGEQKEV
ncbi:MAG: thiamine diphosphokinase [Devosiaceae bacterium]